ncbi:glycoside hydrolase family 25 domain-containing protein [Nocardioides terrisoli]|uniref:hypothetical protein n=1 Tax=Nocardioides terrisoli TaxID=3388267 RepID=UPI00287B6D8D|nr:hypothetical protein [Nocardioides marmorisolisilvae]
MGPVQLLVVVLGAALLAGCGQAPPAGTSATAGLTAKAPDPTRSASGRGPAVPASPAGSASPALPDASGLARRAEAAARASSSGPRVLGADVSWPQCPKGMGIPQKRSKGLPMPGRAARFVVIGLTNSPSFTVNPCLRSQVDWVRTRHLRASAYSVVSYPDDRTASALGTRGPFPADDRLGRLRNVGYRAAAFNVASMRRAGLLSPAVWIDVESVPGFPWSNDTTANAAVVQGAARGYDDAGLMVGVYSTPALWRSVVGDLRLGVPEWRAAGQTSMAEALRRCRPDWSIQGGTAVLGQWVEGTSDRDVTCPGAPASGRWFHQY